MSDDKTLPAPTPDHLEHSEKGAIRGSAAISNETPSAQYVRPAGMNVSAPTSAEGNAGTSTEG